MIFSLQNLYPQNGEIVSKGVVFFKEKATYLLPDSLSVLNLDGTSYLELVKLNDELAINYVRNPSNLKNNLNLKRVYPYYYNENYRYGAPIPKIIIRAYYPDFGVFVMDAKKIGDFEYEVVVNGEWKKIKNKNLYYCDWNIFIKNLIIKLPKNVNLYSKRNVQSKKVSSNKIEIYNVLEVNGDWIKVECNSKCENCNKQKTFQGWVRWKKDNKLLVDLYYVC